MAEPKLGDFFVIKTNSGNALGRFSTWLIRFGTDSKVNHAGVYIGNGQIVEATRGGARLNELKNFKDAIWSTDRLSADKTPTDLQRPQIVSKALKALGTPYGTLDIIAIALAQRRTGNLVNRNLALEDQPWYIKKIASKNTLICSQLVDLVYFEAGVHLFNDGRWEGLVSPGDLDSLLVVH